MNRILKSVAWVWNAIVIVILLAILYMLTGHTLPGGINYYLYFILDEMKWFLSSWVFIPVFTAMWIGFGYHLAGASGWSHLSRRLSNKYMNLIEPDAFILGSGKIGKIFHNGMLKVGFSKSGMVLKVLLPFRFGHPPLYIPWDSVERIDIQKSSIDKKSRFYRIAEWISPYQYANIKLAEFPDQVILVRWKDVFGKDIPQKLFG